MADALAPSRRLRNLAGAHGRRTDPHHAFFFSADLMDPERLVRMTPEPLRKHRVFGAFSIDDFARHL